MRLFAIVSVLCLVGCDTGSTVTPSADASLPQVDAMVASSNSLGVECMTTANCPTDHNCVKLSSGNPDVGYCSPTCTIDTDCGIDYTGPSTGTLACFVPNFPNSCSIQCNSTADCPGTLQCLGNGGPLMFCTTAP